MEWFEDEDFWATYAPFMFDEAHWSTAPEEVEGTLRLAAVPRGGRVLDACCGVGRHSLEFAARGYTVTGVDLTRAFLDAARESADAAGLSDRIEWVRDDIRRFSRPGSFDLCVNLFTSFGYFPSRDDDIVALARLRENLRPGGTLVLETRGKETVAREFIDGEEFTRLGCDVRTEYRIVGDWEGLENRWILESPDGAARVDRSFTLRLYSGTEMRAALAEAGFDRITLHGGLDGRPYDQRAESLVAVAKSGGTT